MDEPTGKITVSNKIPATGVKLNKNNLVIAPKNREVLKAIVSPSNSTDKLSWSSTARRIASVDKDEMLAQQLRKSSNYCYNREWKESIL